MFLNGTDPGLRQIRTPTVDTFTAGVGFTAGSSTTVTLTADPGSENNLIITFDGITQHRDTYSVSGTTVTFDTAISTGVSKIEATYTTTIPAATPGDGTVTEAKLGGAAVTQTKLGDEAVNEAKLQVSNAPTNGYMLTAQSGNTGGLTWAEAGGGAFENIFIAESHATYASMQSVPSGAWTVLNFVTEVLDQGSDFDLANDKLIAPEAGDYMFWGGYNALHGSGSGTDQRLGLLRYNSSGTNLEQINFGKTTVHEASMSGFGTFTLAANDYVNLQSYQASGSAKVIDTVKFMGWKVV